MGRICLTYTLEPERDRWFPGDRFIRPLVRRAIRGRPRPGGIDTVVINLRLGLDRLGIPYVVNLPFSRLRPDDRLAVLGRGRHCLAGYDRRRPFVAGIGLMTHPSEWPTLLTDYPVACYLQHSEWTAAVYRRYFGEKVAIWPVGIDTESWKPTARAGDKAIDFLIYDKIHWERPRFEADLVGPVRALLDSKGLSHMTLRYGSYSGDEFRRALGTCRALIFLSAHESQGIACEEALSSGVPVLAWNPGLCQDPDRFKWGDPVIQTTSVPYFDERCGRTFADFGDFGRNLPPFMEDLGRGTYRPRDYILENLTLEKASGHFADILRKQLP
jgi:glycosyltransferase involved in cell wall biosynthesis